jgi:hypothetical protein
VSFEQTGHDRFELGDEGRGVEHGRSLPTSR